MSTYFAVKEIVPSEVCSSPRSEAEKEVDGASTVDTFYIMPSYVTAPPPMDLQGYEMMTERQRQHIRFVGVFRTSTKTEQAGTGPSRRHIQGSKKAKGLPSVNLQYSKIEKPKNGPSGAPGPASASPWRAEEKNFRKKISQCRKKLKGGWDFSTSIQSQNSKKIEGGPFGEKFFPKKSLAVPKKI